MRKHSQARRSTARHVGSRSRAAAVSAPRWRGAPTPSNDALSYGAAMVALPLVLGLFGAWVDGIVGSSPVLLVVFAAFGVASSFASAIYRYEARIAVHEEGKPWARKASTAKVSTAKVSTRKASQ